MSNRLTKHSQDSNNEKLQREKGGLLKKVAKTIGVLTLSAGVGLGVGAALDNWKAPNAQHENTQSQEGDEVLANELNQMLHRFDACAITGLNDTGEKPEEYSLVEDFESRTRVEVDLQIERNETSMQTEKKYVNDNSIKSDLAALLVELTPPGKDIDDIDERVPVYSPHGFAFEDEDGYRIDGPKTQNVVVDIVPKRQPNGSRLTFSVVNGAYSPKLGGTYEDREKYQQPCGSATMVNGKWVLDLPAEK